ncbi:hypothetical protein A2W14_00390, partial [Candidatus Gottesmanbacteria bacterium RBG_16_37_8]
LLSSSDKTKYKTAKVKINNQTFNLEIADNDALRSQGLSGRKNLTKNDGMLFIFNQKGVYSFWMKEMYIPLDFIWLDGDTIVDLSEKVPPPVNFSSTDIPLITPKFPVDKVMEVKAGTIEELRLKVGQIIEFNN